MGKKKRSNINVKRIIIKSIIWIVGLVLISYFLVCFVNIYLDNKFCVKGFNEKLNIGNRENIYLCVYCVFIVH